MSTDVHRSIGWTRTSEFTWTEEAYRRLLDKRLKYEVLIRDGVVSTRVWGPCPRCEGALDDRQVHSAVAIVENASERGVSGDDDQPARIPIDITCGCGSEHQDAPDEVTGCGVSFRVELIHADTTADPAS